MRSYILCCFPLLLCATLTFQRELVVNQDGNGEFNTIQECVDAASPGDSCLIHEGRYHEEITITGKQNITIKGYQDERPIIDGSVVLNPLGNNGVWRFNKWKGICGGRIKQDVFQLFLDGEMMTNARWPNALWKDKSVFYKQYWGHSDQLSERGRMVDDGHAGLAASGLNMTGAMAVLNVGSFNTFVKPILWHDPKSNNFTYDDDFGNIQYEAKHSRYYLDSSLELLDNPGEWHYDKVKKYLRFIPFNGTCPDPTSDQVRGRTVDYSMMIRNTTGLLVANLDFFASTLHGIATKWNDTIDDITIDSVNFYFPSSSRRMLQEYSVPKSTTLLAKDFGNIKVENCNFIGAEGMALKFGSKKSKIYNNLFKWNDWSGQMSLTATGGGGTVCSEPRSRNAEFIGNTLWYNGASAGYRPGYEGIINDNIIAGQCHGKIMNDGSGVQIQVQQQTGAKLERNWVFDSPKYGLRFDGAPPKIGKYGTMANNVAWECNGLQVKGDNHIVTGNLALDGFKYPDDDETIPSLKVVHKLRESTVVTNANTTVVNNAATRADGGADFYSDQRPKSKFALAGRKTNNYVGEDLRNMLVDVENKDFRPISLNVFSKHGTGDLIGEETGDRIGPYPALGEAITQYAIPGQKLRVASHPIPGHESTVKTRDVLMFRPGFRCESHRIYISSANGGLPGWTTPSKELFKDENGVHNNVVMMTSDDDGRYRWRVDCKDESTGKFRTGDVWKFSIDKSLSS